MRGKKTAESRNEVDIAAVVDGQCLFLNDLLVDYQTDRLGPLNSCSSDFNGTFESILSLTI